MTIGTIQASRRRRVYFGEFDLLRNGSTYLPLVSGLLRAHAERYAAVREHFEFAPFLFRDDRLDRIVGQYEEPAFAAAAAFEGGRA